MTIEWVEQKYWADAELPEGTWRLKERDVVHIGFRPARPEGLDFGDIFKLVAAEKRFKKEFQQDKRRIDYLHAMTGIGNNDEIAYAESVIEARKLVEFIRAGSTCLPPLEDLLAAAELTPYQNPYAVGKYITYQRKIKSGMLDLTMYTEGSVRATFHGFGARCWHNILNLSNDHPSYDKQATVHVFYPEENPDLRRIGAAFIGWLIAERTARERTRFSTPLGGAPKRKH